jgi:hypothetical protein
VNREEKNRASSADATPQDRSDLNEIKHLLRQAMPPVLPHELEPHIDLWPQLRARIESQHNTVHAATNVHRESPGIRIAWFDWALAALAAAALIFFPGIIPALLYHF